MIEGQNDMQTTTNPQLGLLDSLMPSAPANDFFDPLDRVLDWRFIETPLDPIYPATTRRPPCAPIVLFNLSLPQLCYGLLDPQCEERVPDRWR